jgi:hypothetical protein
MGRRWGKTMMTGSVCLASAATGAAVAWVVPTYKNARPVWRFVEQHAAGIAKVSKSDMLAQFPGGGWMGVYTADNDTSMRGEAFDLVAVDEAAQIRPETYTDVIMPTTADRDGLIYLISTPKGKNWFYQEFMRGMAGQAGQSSFTAPSSHNPSPQIQRAAMLAKDRVSERTYRQEWLAQFVDDGAMFVNIDKLAVLQPQPYKPGHTYSIGVDWARSAGGDYTVFIVIDATTREMACMVRLQGMAFENQLIRLRDTWQAYGRPAILAEYNSLGGPLVERLQQAGLPVTGFTTTAATKHEIISGLELAFDQMELKLLNDPVLVMELNAFEKKERAGIPSYSAPAGFHDDTVIATALALYNIGVESVSLIDPSS